MAPEGSEHTDTGTENSSTGRAGRAELITAPSNTQHCSLSQLSGNDDEATIFRNVTGYNSLIDSESYQGAVVFCLFVFGLFLIRNGA